VAAIVVSAITGVATVVTALIQTRKIATSTARETAKTTTQQELTNWRDLLSADTIDAIRSRLLDDKTFRPFKIHGHFVVEQEISEKLLQEVASDEFMHLRAWIRSDSPLFEVYSMSPERLGQYGRSVGNAIIARATDSQAKKEAQSGK